MSRHAPDLIAMKARDLVATHRARDLHEAYSILAKHAATARTAKRQRQRRAHSLWYNHD